MAIDKRSALVAATWAALLLTSACRDRSVENGKPHTALDCMKNQRDVDDYVLETTCSQLGQQMEFEGTWFVGLEVSAFRSGYVAEPAEMGQGDDLIEIVAPASTYSSIMKRSPDSLTAYKISFVGRESSIPGEGGRKVIVLDRMDTIRQVTLR